MHIPSSLPAQEIIKMEKVTLCFSSLYFFSFICEKSSIFFFENENKYIADSQKGISENREKKRGRKKREDHLKF